MPSTIYGIATGKLVDLGIQNIHSELIPGLIKVSLARGQGGMVGEGKNIWSHVHIDESKCLFNVLHKRSYQRARSFPVADLYVVLYNSIMSNPATGHGRDGYYFGENGEYTHYEVAKAVAQALVAKGLGMASEPTSFTEEEYKQLPIVSGAQLAVIRNTDHPGAARLSWHELSLPSKSLPVYRLETRQNHRTYACEHQAGIGRAFEEARSARQNSVTVHEIMY